MTAPTLETHHIVLRQVSLADAPAMQFHFANWAVVKWIGGIPWPYPADGARLYISRRLEEAGQKEICFWGISLKERPEELIGAIEYRFLDDDDENRGFWLSEDYWGRGIMMQAVVATQDFVFFELGKTRLQILSLKTNAASKAIKTKTGGKIIGESTGTYHNGPRAEDVWEVTKDRWIVARQHL